MEARWCSGLSVSDFQLVGGKIGKLVKGLLLCCFRKQEEWMVIS